ncbi:hypothetical protein [Thermostichus vulcanus]|nr:hypothetical protein [Thermostichus vulcanus]
MNWDWVGKGTAAGILPMGIPGFASAQEHPVVPASLASSEYSGIP